MRVKGRGERRGFSPIRQRLVLLLLGMVCLVAIALDSMHATKGRPHGALLQVELVPLVLVDDWSMWNDSILGGSEIA
jgi:hypothetical protein